MKRKTFLSLILFTFSLLVVVGVFSATRTYYIHGSFTPNNATWTGGYPGKVLFDIGLSNSGYTSTIDEVGYLSGYFWLGNVGWSTFNHGDSTCQAQIMCPEDILTNPNQLCPVHGCVWTQNSGWVVLSGSDIGGSYTGVYYNPNTTLIEGFGWSHNLGWVPFYSGVGPVSPTSQSGITASGLNINFVGKITIIGNIAGTRIFDLPNQNVGYVYTTTNHASIMNTIHKNIALLTRNISDAVQADETSPFSFVVQKSGDYAFDIGHPNWPIGKRTIVVVGHDIVLDTENDIGSPTDGVTKALIALKDNMGNGGNIIISDKVRRVYSFLYAEGSIFSGEKVAGNIVPYVSSGALNIPARQLYIKGLLISKNTIGGAQQTPPVCPVVVNNCTITSAQLYDLNYFRTYVASDASQKSVPSWITDQRLEDATFIIDYDSSILIDPPPGTISTIQ